MLQTGDGVCQGSNVLIFEVNHAVVCEAADLNLCGLWSLQERQTCLSSGRGSEVVKLEIVFGVVVFYVKMETVVNLKKSQTIR